MCSPPPPPPLASPRIARTRIAFRESSSSLNPFCGSLSVFLDHQLCWASVGVCIHSRRVSLASYAWRFGRRSLPRLHHETEQIWRILLAFSISLTCLVPPSIDTRRRVIRLLGSVSAQLIAAVRVLPRWFVCFFDRFNYSD
jgi:hypothetical protein